MQNLIKHPSSNIQAPEKFQTPKVKIMSANGWSLNLEDSLELGGMLGLPNAVTANENVMREG